jgi:xanthine dehydrogenase molybdopterin-binding subunit B
MAVGAVSIFITICSTTADAKGFGMGSAAPSDPAQQIDRRLTKIEEQQKAMQDTIALELKKVRAELDSIKAQSAIKTDLTTAR